MTSKEAFEVWREGLLKRGYSDHEIPTVAFDAGWTAGVEWAIQNPPPGWKLVPFVETATMTDKELLELAAKATGISPIDAWPENIEDWLWNPLVDDGDALRLAVMLNLSADFFNEEICIGYTPNCNDCDQVTIPVGSDPYAATRRAIVMAAAEIGKGMK